MRLLILGPVLVATLAATSLHAQSRGFRLPPQAQKIEDDTYYLGKARDHDGREVEGIAFLHPKRGAAKGAAKPGKPPGAGGSVCYSLMSSGAKWKTAEPYVVDGSGAFAVPQSSVLGLIESCLFQWEEACGRVNIFGPGFDGQVKRGEVGQLNWVNEFMFGEIGEPGVIAVTFVWGRFSGPAALRELVEWDMMFDETDFDFGDANAEGGPVMDFLNILQHESGHAAGLAHPSSSCVDETMYAYAGLDETKKRDLAPGDIAGINELYR